MELASKYFEELTTIELYEILKARSKIFVVDQKCVYQDLYSGAVVKTKIQDFYNELIYVDKLLVV